MTEFFTWDMLMTYATFTTTVFMVVEFTKGLKILDWVQTKYYSFVVAFVLISLTQLHGGTFRLWDIVIYILSAITISLSSNGLSDFNNYVDKTKKDGK